MSSKESASLRSCSTSFAASKVSKNSFFSSISNSYSRQSLRGSESLSPISRVSKDVLNKRPCSKTYTRGNVSPKGNPQDVLPNSCFCSDCATLDIPKHHLQNLEDRFRNLKQELCKERNQSNLLRRDVMIAKKIVKREVGSNSDSVDCLLQKANGEDWMGRQEMIYILKRKLRDLNEMVERLEENTSYTKRSRSRREQSPVSDIPDERKLFWCLELERQDVLKKAAIDRQRWIANRGVLAVKLQEAANKNEELMNELRSLRDQITTTPKIIDEGVSGRLQKLGNQLRTHLDEKVEDRQKLDGIKLQICRSTKVAVELRDKIAYEKQIVKDKGDVVNSLLIKDGDLRLVVEETRKENNKGTNIMKKKLKEMEQDYTLIVIRVDKMITLMSDSKSTVGKLERLRTNCRASNIASFRKSAPVDNDDEEKLSLEVKSQPNIGSTSKKSLEVLRRNRCNYESKLEKYKSFLKHLDQKNLEKWKQVDSTVGKINEMVISYLMDRNALWKRTVETALLKRQIKKMRKSANPSSKLKMVRQKDSFQQLGQTLDVRKQYLSILKAKFKSMKILIKSIFSSTHDDFDLVKVFLCMYKELFLQEVY